MKKNSFLRGAALCCAAILLAFQAGCQQSVPTSASSSEASSAQEEESVITVEVTPASLGTIQSNYVYSGKVTPTDTVNVVSTMSGTVKRAGKKVGDKVKKGEVLFTLDTADLESSITVLKAQLKASEAQVASAKTGVELVNGASMQAQIESAKTGLQQAQLAVDNAQITYDQNKQLLTAGIISQSDMDKTETALQNTKIAYEQAKQSHDIIVNKMPAENVRKAKDGLTAAQAGLDAAKAQLASTREKLDDATVTAPISGVLAQYAPVEGTLLVQTAGAAATIISTDKVNLRVGVSEQLVNGLKDGQKVDVKVAAASPDILAGKIKSVSPAANQSGTYDVDVELENTDGLLKSGMFGEVHFVKEKIDNTIVLPRSAVISANDENYLFVMDGGKAKRVDVTIGIDTGSEIQVLQGLAEGEQVVTMGQNFLKDGDKIQLAGASSSESEETSSADGENGGEESSAISSEASSEVSSQEG